MYEEDEDADMPQICQIAENDEEDRKAMMKSIFEEIAFRTDKDMTEESAEVFAELHNVESFHSVGGFRNTWSVLSHVIRRTMTSQPGRHERSAD